MSKNLLCVAIVPQAKSHMSNNVLKFTYSLVKDPQPQMVYYQPGSGTMELPGALTPLSQKVIRLLGKAIG